MILSLLIPTIPERHEKLFKLLADLHGQIFKLYSNHPSLGIIEILVDDSKKFLEGGLTIGMKRNSLVQRAVGKYLCFLDDDDQVTPNYVEQIVRMCNEGKDIITFRTLIKNDHYWGLIDMNLETKENSEVNPLGVINRTPWHICPVLSRIGKKETFSNLNHNEDWDWMKRVLEKVKTQTHTEMILTQYNHSESGSEADKILKENIEEPHVNSLIISLAIDGREKYTDFSRGLEESTAKNWKGDVRYFKQYPSYCTPHSIVPYKFKCDLIRKARADGYKKVFWLDSSMRVVKDLNELIDDNGIMAFDNLGHPLKNYISDKAVQNLELKDLDKIPQTWGGALGFDFSKDKACQIFEEWVAHSLLGSFETSGSTRPGFISHRHDQAVLSGLLWKHDIKLIPYGKIVAAVHAREPFEYGKDYYLIYGD